jgi:uncharacterized lipoprotein YmbA
VIDRMHKTRRITLIISACIWLAAGCRSASPPVFYYTLQPLADRPLEQAGPSIAGPAIGIGAVELPDYLDHRFLVTRTSPEQVQFQEAHRWAGTLRDDVQRVLSENLEILTGARRVETLPWPAGFSPDVRLRVVIGAFEGEPGKTLNLSAAWWISQDDRSVQPQLKSAVIEEPVTANSMQALTAAMSRALAELSRQIALSIISYK